MSTEIIISTNQFVVRHVVVDDDVTVDQTIPGWIMVETNFGTIMVTDSMHICIVPAEEGVN